MENELINLHLYSSDNQSVCKDSRFKQALKDYWEVSSIVPLRFRYSVRDVATKWGEETVKEITKNYFVTCNSDKLVCPACDNPIEFSSRCKLNEILKSKTSMLKYCKSEKHDEFLEKKILEHSDNVFMFSEQRYLGQPEWTVLNSSPVDLLKILSVYLEVGTTSCTINMAEDYEEEAALQPYTRSLLPELLRKGYVFYVNEEVPYPDDVIRSMHFLNEYYPKDRKPKKFGVHIATSWSRLGVTKIERGYRINPATPIVGDIIESCICRIQMDAYTESFLEEVESMLIDARAKTLLHIVELVGDKYNVPVSYLGSSDLVMKRIAEKLSIEKAIELCCFSAEKCRYLLEKPGVQKYVKARYFLSNLSKSFEELQLHKGGELPTQTGFDFQNKCGFDTAIFLVFNLDCDLNTLSVEQVMKKLYLELNSQSE
ncbi:MAG: hypothetical protein CMF11_01430, partial [Idiomarina sp.]|nr:hypothetical protein [Idiomarina sp.]